MEFLDPARDWPWRLVTGNVIQNLLALKELEAFGTTTKIWDLLHLKEDLNYLEVTVAHVSGKVARSTMGIEQYIGATSIMQKSHRKRYGWPTLGARTLLRGAYPTTRKPDEKSTEMKKNDAEIARLQKKRPATFKMSRWHTKASRPKCD